MNRGTINAQPQNAVSWSNPNRQAPPSLGWVGVPPSTQTYGASYAAGALAGFSTVTVPQ